MFVNGWWRSDTSRTYVEPKREILRLSRQIFLEETSNIYKEIKWNKSMSFENPQKPKQFLGLQGPTTNYD